MLYVYKPFKNVSFFPFLRIYIFGLLNAEFMGLYICTFSVVTKIFILQLTGYPFKFKCMRYQQLAN